MLEKGRCYPLQHSGEQGWEWKMCQDDQRFLFRPLQHGLVFPRSDFDSFIKTRTMKSRLESAPASSPAYSPLQSPCPSSVRTRQSHITILVPVHPNVDTPRPLRQCSYPSNSRRWAAKRDRSHDLRKGFSQSSQHLNGQALEMVVRVGQGKADPEGCVGF